jgi:tetratricopeptide (TPR) repeat protein
MQGNSTVTPEMLAAVKKRGRVLWGVLIAVSVLSVAAIVLTVLIPTVFIPTRDYNAAIALMDEGRYDEAIEAFEAMEGYRDSAAMIENCRAAKIENAYQNAIALFEAGSYAEAVVAFLTLDGYRDSASYIAQCNRILNDEAIKRAKVGDVIQFGTYYFDAEGKEKSPIEWIVIDRDAKTGRLFIISKYVLEAMPYHNTDKDVLWAKSSLRSWLNGTFFKTAFDEEARARILSTELSTLHGVSFGKYTGEKTTDRIFLLKSDECKHYAEQLGLLCKATPYAIAKQPDIRSDDTNYCSWWLRNLGENGYTFACEVNYNHYTGGAGIFSPGSNQKFDDIGVRPCMWITIE